VTTPEHPIRQFLDWAAVGGRPTDAEYAEVVTRCVDEHTNLPAAKLLRELHSAVGDIRRHHVAGESGAARTIARETTDVLASALGDIPPAPSRTAGMTTRAIIDSIPR